MVNTTSERDQKKLFSEMKFFVSISALVLLLAVLKPNGINGSCSSFQDMLACSTILDAVTSQSSRECAIAEKCLQNLSCCCSIDLPYQQRIRCRVRKGDIGYEIFRLNLLCKIVVIQQPNQTGC